MAEILPDWSHEITVGRSMAETLVIWVDDLDALPARDVNRHPTRSPVGGPGCRHEIQTGREAGAMNPLTTVNNLSLKCKLALLLLIPGLGLLCFISFHVFDRYNDVRQMHAVGTLAQLNGELSALVHELQKERGR